MGITIEERAKLAEINPVNQSLWWVPIQHFSPWDCNWPFGPPSGAGKPNSSPPCGDEKTDNPCQEKGSIIDIQNQTLREQVNITGTPFDLCYSSERVKGRNASRTLSFNLSGDTVPNNLKRIDLVVSVAGRLFTQEFTATPNQKSSFTWDGKDAYGRNIQGKKKVLVSIGYVYDAVYYEPNSSDRSFGDFSGIPITGSRAREEVTLWQHHQSSLFNDGMDNLGTWDAQLQGLGGWTIDVHHVYDPIDRVMYLGNGERQSVYSKKPIITTIAGSGEPGYQGRGYSGDEGPASVAKLAGPESIAVASDGTIYVADTSNHCIRKILLDGIITTIAGTGTSGFSGDGGLATQAEISYPSCLVVGRDGSIYFVDDSNRIRKIGSDGIITTVAGNGNYGYSGDGGAAINAELGYPQGIDVSPDGIIFIADSGNSVIRKVGIDGIITTIAGNGDFSYYGDGGSALNAALYCPEGVTLGPDGGIYIADTLNYRVRRVSSDGIINTVVGNGNSGFIGDGGQADQAEIDFVLRVYVGSDNSLYFSDVYNFRVRKVGPDGIIKTIAGTSDWGFDGDGGTATQAMLAFAMEVALSPDGVLYIADSDNNRIRKVDPVLSGFPSNESTTGYMIPSSNGNEVYRFDGKGCHLSTLDALTGTVKYRFTYDVNGYLNGIQDSNNNITLIERSFEGNPLAIVSPYQQRTVLSLNPKGYIEQIKNSANETVNLTYYPDGLLETYTNPRNLVSRFTYDIFGRLTKDEYPGGGYIALQQEKTINGFQITKTETIDGVKLYSSTYLTEKLPNGKSRSVISSCCGSPTESMTDIDGSQTITSSDGTVIRIIEGPDPRFGMKAPLEESITITTPSGKSFAQTRNRTVILVDSKRSIKFAEPDRHHHHQRQDLHLGL